jgi:hypothetical protein
MRTASIVHAAVAFVPTSPAAAPRQVEVKCRVCSTEAIPEPLRRAHAQFTVVVSGRADGSGGMLDLKVILAPRWMNSEPLLRCLRRWRVVGLSEGTSVTVALSWKWGGWRRMSIAAEGVRYEVDLEPDEGDEQ